MANKLDKLKTRLFSKTLSLHDAVTLFNTVRYVQNPDIKLLEQLANYHDYQLGTLTQLRALHLKLELLKYEPSELERSMTQRQLYDLKNNWWLNPYSIEKIETYLYFLENSQIDKDELFTIMTQLV